MCFIDEESNEQFCFECKNSTFFNFEEIGRCYSATDGCPGTVTTPNGEILPVFPDARDLENKMCSFNCPSGTFRNELGGSTNENNTCVVDCTDVLVVTNWNDAIHVVDYQAEACVTVREGCSFGYGLEE